jgi:hypothetical protein
VQIIWRKQQMDIFIGSLVFVILPIALIVFIGLFFKKHPIKNSKSTNAFDLVKEFKVQFGGVKGVLVLYGFGVLFVAVIVLRVFNIFN